ncbi:outer membrane lipoprotein-sorting protein [Marinivivus vitaminiproducens]|uniref:outer membrane lipoprotein-sorting protein n=1 Tax=Marinivivus vitaminiproducens TaxID=3035935 RepID=UPI00279FDD22|nr:outer membrane lipoprotein-sorting protein [Geminicoccaceae bacterium SCSIO 64248]
MLLATAAFIGAVFSAVSEVNAADVNCHDVTLGIEQRYNGYDSWRVMNMEITDANGGKKFRRIHAGHENIGTHRRLRSIVIEPAELAGFEAIAFDYFNDGETDKVWTYLPSQGTLYDVRSEELSGRLYGSDLAIGEMLIRRSKDYDCRYLGEGEYKGFPVWKLYVDPRHESEVIRLGLRDGEVWVEKNTFLPVWSTFNAAAAGEQRVFETDEIRVIDGVMAPAWFRVSTRKEGRVVSTSVFRTEGERFNIGMPIDWFQTDDIGNAESAWNTFRTETATQ